MSSHPPRINDTDPCPPPEHRDTLPGPHREHEFLELHGFDEIGPVDVAAWDLETADVVGYTPPKEGL